MHSRVETRVQERLRAPAQHVERVDSATQSLGHVPDKALLDVFVDGLEQVALVPEVVVERAAGHPRGPYQLFGGRAGEPALGEQGAAGGDEGRPRPLGLLRFGRHAYCLYVYDTPSLGGR